MNDYAQMIVARDRMDGYLREAEQARLARVAREARGSRGAVTSPHAGTGFGAVLTLRELRRVVLRRLLGEAATA